MRDFLLRMGKSIGLLSIFLLLGTIFSVPVHAQCLADLKVESIQVQPESCSGANDGQVTVTFSHWDDNLQLVLFNMATKGPVMTSPVPGGVKIEHVESTSQLKITNLFPANYALQVINKNDLTCYKSFGDENTGLFEIMPSENTCKE